MLRLLCLTFVGATFLPRLVTAQDIDPIGFYEWEVDAGGQYLTGTFEIKQGDDGWTGTAVSDEGESPMKNIEVTGSVVSFVVQSMTYGEVFVELHIEGERFTGLASVGAEQVPMVGTKSGG